MVGLRTRELFFVALLVVITLLTTADLVADYWEGTDVWHLALEAVVVILSVFGITFLIREVTLHQQELEKLKQQLKVTRKDLDQSREHLKIAGQEFTRVIQEQFDTWSLTPSEREVSILLLKGLSFEEISTIRNTKEKTVRQQASSIYRKSGLNGRHEFAAWFFEDLIQ